MIGWYSDPSHEPIKQYQDLLQKLSEEDNSGNFLKDFAWRLVDQKTPDFQPDRCFFYAKLVFKETLPPPDLDLNSSSAGTTVTLANSPSEAFSASIADKMSQEEVGRSKQKIEEQLEALLLFKKLSNNNSDRYALFNESFHENGFTAINGGYIWRVTATNTTPKDSATQDKTADASKGAREITLPKQISHYLKQCNLVQQRVYALSDWYKYTLSAYPDDDGQNDPPAVDEIKLYIEARRLRELDKAIEKARFLRDNLQEKLDRLDQALKRINHGEIPTQVLFQRFDSHDTANSDRLVDNRPFSEKCLAANGINFSKTIALSDPIQGLSLWVNIAYLRKSCINGKKQDPYLPLDWLDIPKDSWTHIYLEMDRPLSVTIHLFSNGEEASYCKAKLAGVRCFSTPLSEDEIFADRNMFQQRQYKLQQKVAPRYWQPNEPYVLLQGGNIKPTERHGSDGRLSEDGTLLCHVVDDEGINGNSLAGAKWAQSQIQNIAKPWQIGYSTWDAQPWHPFMLEWQAEVFPLAKNNNLNASTGGQYHPDFLKSNFDLRENQPDLAAKANNRVVKAASIYRGSVILTPHAQKNLIDSLEDLLDNLTPADCYQVYKEINDQELRDYDHKLKSWFADKFNLKKAIADWRDQKPSDEQKMESWLAQKPTFKKHISQFQCWYKKKPVVLDASEKKCFNDLDENRKADNAIYVAILALQKTYLGGMNCLSQSLSGFNAALLAHKQTMQIPISEPLGFDAYKNFTARIREYVDKESKVAPQPDNDFLPIRSGTMNLLRLTLVDTFGLVANDLDVLNLITPEKNHVREPRLKGDPEREHFLLSPAFVQPTRLNFPWLSAANGDQEMNDHPASSPICGWLLPNNLDGSVMVYDQAGSINAINLCIAYQLSINTVLNGIFLLFIALSIISSTLFYFCFLVSIWVINPIIYNP